MRQDAKNLLKLLDRKDLTYRQFADPFADMELWPIFEALLTDERVLAGRANVAGSPEVQPRSRGSGAGQGAGSSAKAGLFARYGEGGTPDHRTSEAINVRQFLSSISGTN
jgi:hypothetical protein